jgi:hypothetical protein
MRSSVVAACLLAACLFKVDLYAPAASVRQQLPLHPHQARTLPAQCQTHNDLDRQATPRPVLHRGTASINADGATVRPGAQSHKRSGGPAIDTQPPQPGSQQTGNRQLPGPVGLLLALALVDGGSATRHETPRTQTH